MSGSFDLVILGSGTTAFAGALRASAQGARVLMVEQRHLGGTCVNWGCIPSKSLIDKAETNFAARRGRSFGLNLVAGEPDCEQLMAAKRLAVETLRREKFQKILDRDPNIEVLRGHGRFISSRELQVGPQVLVAERFLVATGGFPRTLRLPGLPEIDYLTSYSALHLTCFPRSLVIIGGGVIALEMGQMFSRFGVKVTILERGSRVLKEFDPRLTAEFQELLEGEGMTLHFGVQIEKVRREGDQVCVIAEGSGERREFRAERLMFAVGTAPATADVGLEEAGVEVDANGFIVTDDRMRTAAGHIWAAGDVTGPPLIAPAGAHEAEVAVDDMLGAAGRRRVDHRQTPMAVFVDPEFATVGLSGEQARKAGYEVAERFLDLQEVAKAHVMGGRRGGVLLTAETTSGLILGVQMLAPRAADAIHEAALAIRCGLTVHDLAGAVHIHPTISEGLRQTALATLSELRGRPGPVSAWHSAL